jgi:SAM-dependent methyltransferase
MSDEPVSQLPPEVCQRTLARFDQHRRAWNCNPALRICYREWYGIVRSHLPSPDLGPWVEIGSGPGLAREFIPEMLLTDIVQAPWHDRQALAESLPFPAASVGALVLFDVLHHVGVPPIFFAEADRVLRPGGRIVLIEPYISPLSQVIYGHFHEEPSILSVDPLALAPVTPEQSKESKGSQKAGDSQGTPDAKDPFTSNQAIPTLLFARHHARRFAQAFPNLVVTRLRRLAGLAYPATGGFNRPPLLPFPLWRALYFAEGLLPEFAFRLFGFRMLVVIEKR